MLISGQMGYLNFYNIKEPPFANIPDLRFFYNQFPFDESMKRVLAGIEDGKRVMTIIGGCGFGKTIISRKVLSMYEEDDDRYEIGLLVCLHSDMGAGWLMNKLAIQLHISVKEGESAFEKVAEKYLQICEKGVHGIIIIDEASMIENQAVFDEIRGLIDFMADNKLKFTVLFFGLPALEGKLAFNEPLLHRVESRTVLKTLPTTTEIRKYITHRLSVAGCEKSIFTDEAIHKMNETAKGNPRVINIICDNALTEGYLNKQEIITEKEIERVIIEMGYSTRLKSLFLDVAKATALPGQNPTPANPQS